MILIVDMGWKKGSLARDEFCLPIARIAEQFEKCEIRHFSELSAGNMRKYSRIILSGAALKDNEFVNHQEGFQWLKACEKPVLGICAGMDIMGLVFGGRLEKAKEIGMEGIGTVKKNPLFSGRFMAYCLHSFSIRLPKGFEVLAKSRKCVEAVRHRERPFYGVLFHPEVRNPEIIERFISSC